MARELLQGNLPLSETVVGTDYFPFRAWRAILVRRFATPAERFFWVEITEEKSNLCLQSSSVGAGWVVWSLQLCM